MGRMELPVSCFQFCWESSSHSYVVRTHGSRGFLQEGPVCGAPTLGNTGRFAFRAWDETCGCSCVLTKDAWKCIPALRL